MDIILKKKHPIIRYKSYIIGGCVVLGLLIYVLVASSGPSRLRYEADKLQITEVRNGKFMEYLDVEGIVQPIITVKLNALENGSVTNIVANNGDMLKQGDTIMVLNNPELMRTIEDERDNLEKQRITYKQKEIEMQQKSSELRRRSIETAYKLRQVSKQYGLVKAEHGMGIQSKAQLDLAEDEYLYNSKNTQLIQEELQHDSLMNVIQSDLMRNDMQRQEKTFERIRERVDGLIVRAPIAGQLSFISVIQGERVTSGGSLGELKVVDRFKISTKISEYYIDRITSGLPATVIYQGQRFPMKITKVNPEIKDRQFDVDLVFTGDLPESIRIGKNYRIQVELGQPEDALIMDKGNFFQSTGGRWIFRLNKTGDKAVKTDISIGRQNPQQYEVLNGLREGDRVIVSGYDHFGDAQELIIK